MDENMMREGIEVEETVVETAPVTENTVEAVEQSSVGEKVFVGATLALAAWKVTDLAKKAFDFGKEKFHRYKTRKKMAALMAQDQAKADKQTEQAKADKQTEQTPEQNE